MTYLHRVTFLAIVMLAMPGAGVAQWATQSGGAVTYTGGNVGIGTTSPGQALTVVSSQFATTQIQNVATESRVYFDGAANTGADLIFQENGVSQFSIYTYGGSTAGLGFYPNDGGTSTMFLTNAGNVGIGTTTPRSTGYVPSGWLDTAGGIFISNGANVGATSFASTTTFPPNGGLIALNKSNSQGEIDFFNLSGTGSDGGFAFYDRDTPLMRIMKGGNVGIGTLSPQYPLSVNGIIQAKEVIVNTGWSDYVFDASYRLAPLTEVAEYVEANHHLPGMPSSGEVAEKGIGVGEIESKLLAKIEELTLHMIEADRENRALRERVQKLESGRQK
jgi:hypothetical protein